MIGYGSNFGASKELAERFAERSDFHGYTSEVITLNDLADMGELNQLDLGTGSTRFDPNTDVHHHLVCTNCGKVRDLYADYRAISVPAGAGEGFVVGAAEVVFRGLCQACQTPQIPETKQR